MEDKFAPLPHESGGAPPPRAAPRESMFLQADVQAEGAAPQRGLRVRNLSAGGLMVETTHSFVRGAPVTVTLRNLGALAGRIAWTAPGRVGIALDREIDPREVRKAPPPASPGTTMLLTKPAAQSRRPGLKMG